MSYKFKLIKFKKTINRKLSKLDTPESGHTYYADTF